MPFLLSYTRTHTYIHIYIYHHHHHHHHHQVALTARSSLTSIASGKFSKLHLVSTQHWYKSLMVSQHWHVHVQESIRKHRLWVRPCFFAIVQHVLNGLGDGRLVAVQLLFLLGVASRISLKQHATFLCSFHLAFSLCVLLASMWCILTIVRTQPQLGRNPVLFYQIDQISIGSITFQ